jgi:hypothetical protein
MESEQVKRLFILVYDARISLDRLRRSRLYTTRHSVATLSIHCYSLSHTLPSSFVYPNAVLHSRIVGQSLSQSTQSRRIASSPRVSEGQRCFSVIVLYFRRDLCPNRRLRTSASPITSVSHALPPPILFLYPAIYLAIQDRIRAYARKCGVPFRELKTGSGLLAAPLSRRALTSISFINITSSRIVTENAQYRPWRRDETRKRRKIECTSVRANMLERYCSRDPARSAKRTLAQIFAIAIFVCAQRRMREEAS